MVILASFFLKLHICLNDLHTRSIVQVSKCSLESINCQVKHADLM